MQALWKQCIIRIIVIFDKPYYFLTFILQTLESIDLDGKDRKVVLKDLPYPYGVTVWNGRLFWTDWQTRAIHEASQPREKLKGNLVSIMDIHYFDLERKGNDTRKHSHYTGPLCGAHVIFAPHCHPLTHPPTWIVLIDWFYSRIFRVPHLLAPALGNPCTSMVYDLRIGD